ncbi:MAG: hypothetical protein IJT33_02400 [Campylobacter sp.]|nr:hypothetical protein [Campylobacter sp.]MBQ7675299.1 hypothetical protein [Campylobacter sp.]MBQ9875681.1 hypothetical protein [Campylobacter sp.]MBR0071927.1 hypothetical protein [Campylobacter sp.]
MVRKLLLFCSVAFFISCSDTQNKSSDKCSDGAIQFDIIAAKSNMPTTEEDVNLKDVYCVNNTFTYVYTINMPNEKPAMKARKDEFNKAVMGELLEFFCNDNSLEIYSIKKNDMSLKWQYFFKDETEIFSEFSVNKSMCEK